MEHCLICFEDIEKAMSCGHFIHEDCMKKAFKHKPQYKCPICFKLVDIVPDLNINIERNSNNIYQPWDWSHLIPQEIEISMNREPDTRGTIEILMDIYRRGY